MCKVVKYWFACHHGFRLRHSKCGGSKHKNTRGGLAAACKSEAYLNFIFATSCGPCQYQAFDNDWKQKLRLAELYLETLKEKGFPGVQEVTALVGQLKDDFNTATWETRAVFPHAHKQRAVRVGLGSFEKAPSPLRNEVFPEDIQAFPEVIIAYEHPDYKYDWDYIASTDPLHPVDTNYAHPLDDVDPSWMLNHLSLEEFEQCGEGTGFDDTEADTTWAGSMAKLNMDPIDWTDERVCASEATETYSTNNSSNHAPEGEACATLTICEVEAGTEDEQLLADRVNMVIHEFWSLVNANIPPEHSFQDEAFTLNGDTDIEYERLSSSETSSDSKAPQTGLLTPPRTPPKLPSDGTCDLDFSSQSPPKHTITSPFINVDTRSSSSSSRSARRSAPSSTRSFYNRWRQDISPIRDVDRAKFNRELLFLSRCEIKDVEGPNGRFVLDPQLPRGQRQ